MVLTLLVGLRGLYAKGHQPDRPSCLHREPPTDWGPSTTSKQVLALLLSGGSAPHPQNPWKVGQVKPSPVLGTQKGTREEGRSSGVCGALPPSQAGGTLLPQGAFVGQQSRCPASGEGFRRGQLDRKARVPARAPPAASERPPSSTDCYVDLQGSPAPLPATPTLPLFPHVLDLLSPLESGNRPLPGSEGPDDFSDGDVFGPELDTLLDSLVSPTVPCLCPAAGPADTCPPPLQVPGPVPPPEVPPTPRPS